MTLTNEEIQIVRLLCDIVTDLPSPENEQVEKLLVKAETIITKTTNNLEIKNQDI